MATTIAIDPSLSSAGFAVLRDGHLITYGRTSLRTHEQVSSLVNSLLASAEYAADVVAIEVTYIGANAKTGIDLACLRGRLLQLFEQAGCPIVLVAPSTWRKVILSPPPKAKRKALKALAKAWCLTRFGLTLQEDEADASCVAVWAASQLAPISDSTALI